MARIFKVTCVFRAYFFFLAKNILVQILNSPEHSDNKTILCVLFANGLYDRVPLMMENRICYELNFRMNFKKDGKVQMAKGLLALILYQILH